MLIFFSAWHTGLDLKEAHQTWDEKFAVFDFKPGHQQIMQNIKVKYKCFDAWDDFSLQCHRNAQVYGTPPMEYSAIPNDIIDDIDKDNSFEIDMDVESMSFGCIGHKTVKWECY